MNLSNVIFASAINNPFSARSAQAMHHKPFKRLTLLVLEATGLKPVLLGMILRISRHQWLSPLGLN